MSNIIRFFVLFFWRNIDAGGAVDMISVDREEFIAAMRNVASSVSVVTTDGVAGRHGATVSAFCSVSADPPTVLVCLNATSKIAEYVRRNGVFRVNVLPDGATEIADRFAGKHDCNVSDRFEGLPLNGHFAGATSLSCALTQQVVEGTHLICIGRVEGVRLGTGLPLTYLAGKYHTLATAGAVQ
jgi:flavin reductase (DIM6/NTAB) family NADH-FMN oxidoreductase RutF